MTKEIGLRAMASFMIGNPGEEKEDVDKSFELAKKISPDYVQFFTLLHTLALNCMKWQRKING